MGELTQPQPDTLEADLDAIVAAIPMDAPEVPEFDQANPPRLANLEAKLCLPLLESAPTSSSAATDNVPIDEEAPNETASEPMDEKPRVTSFLLKKGPTQPGMQVV